MPRVPQPDWPARAEQMAAAVPRGRLHARVLAWTEAQARSRRPWAVAFSGGADSLLLLLLLWAHWPARRSRLLVLHYNHRLRGAAAAADARFCARVASALGLACVVGRWTDRPPVTRVSEAAARTARHAFFDATLREHRARALWLGHQLDDVAETLFMRLARGSGTGGMAAPRPVQSQPGGRVNLRPLLGMTKADIHAVLQGAGAPWREDASNAQPVHLRNRLRGEVLPAWIRAVHDRDALAGAGLTRERLEEDDEALEAWVDQVSAMDGEGGLNLEALAGLPVAVWRRALRRWLGACGVETDLSRMGFETLLDALRTRRHGRFSIGRKTFAVWRRGRLTLAAGPK